MGLEHSRRNPVILLTVLLIAECHAQHVMLITIDTLRADHLHCFGYSLRTSPELDKVSADGYVFTSAFTPIPLTLPAHAAIMTGSYPERTGVQDNGEVFINTNSASLAEVFREHGYDTGAIVSSLILSKDFGLNKGFEYYNDNLVRGRPGRVKRPADQDVDLAIAWIRRHTDSPFFLWIHLYDVHRPYRVPLKFLTEFQSPYDASIAFTDHELGRLFSYLRNSHLYEHTTIAVVGDHGEGLGDHGEETHGFFIYDSTLHVPLILKPAITGPSFLPRGVAISAAVESLDLYPTLIQMALPNRPYSSGDGRSLLPLIRGTNLRSSNRPLFAENRSIHAHFGWSEIYSVRIGRYKFIEAPRPELYNTELDPKENHNLVDTVPAIAAALRSRLTSYEKGVNVITKARARVDDPRLAQILEGLGYVPAKITRQDSDAPAIDPKERTEAIRLYLRANELGAREQIEDSIALIQEALAIAPESPPLHRLLGMLQLKMPPEKSRLESARKEFERELALVPDDFSSVLQLAAINMSLGDFVSASNLLARYIELNPSDPSGHIQLGDCLIRLKRNESALVAYRKAVLLSPKSALAWRTYGAALLAENKLAQAKNATRRAISIDPRDTTAHELLSKVYLHEGKAQLSRQERLFIAESLNGTSME